MASIDATLALCLIELCQEAHAAVRNLHKTQASVEANLAELKSRIEIEKQVRNRLLDILRLYKAGAAYEALQNDVDAYNHAYDEAQRRKILEGE